MPKTIDKTHTIRQKYVHKQSKMESQRNAAYIKNIKKKCNRHQHNTNDDGQAEAMGEEMRHVQNR